MRGRPVRLQRELNNNEIEYLSGLLMSGYTSRASLVAFFLLEANEGEDNLDIANRAVKLFQIEGSKDPLGSTRSNLIRTLNDFNDLNDIHKVIEKRGSGKLQLQKWTDETIADELRRVHRDLGEQFTYQKLKEINPSLIAVIENRGRFSDYLLSAGIDPLCHLSDFRWDYAGDPKVAIRTIIDKLSRQVGLENINLHSIERGVYRELLDPFRTPSCEECKNCPTPHLVGNNLWAAVSRNYPSWKAAVLDALNITDDVYDSVVERKKFKVGWMEYFSTFQQYVAEVGSDWSVIDFFNRFGVAHHGLHNNGADLPFIEQCNKDVMKAVYAEFVYQQLDVEDRERFWTTFGEAVSISFETKRKTDPRARLRGYEFEGLFLEMLVSDEVGFIEGEDFQYNLSESPTECESKGHISRCRPDFRFENFWIDTKTTITSSLRVVEQLDRYLTHIPKLLVVTIKQSGHRSFEEHDAIEIITVYEFIDRASEYIGRSVPEFWKDKFLAWEKTLD